MGHMLFIIFLEKFFGDGVSIIIPVVINIITRITIPASGYMVVL